jgi:mannose-6-phosphate isomerase-like protein (cupin superfamily)
VRYAWPMNGNSFAERFRAYRSGDGPAFWFLGTLVHVRASAADTNGAFTLIEQVASPGFGPPLHVHHVEDEEFFVLEGVVTFRCGDRDVELTAGGSIFLPKGVPHAFRVEGSSPARLLQFTTPGGFDRFVEEVGVPAPQKVLPPAGPPPAGLLERVAALGEKFHFTIVGPPL